MLVWSQWQWNRKNACYLLQPTSLWAFDEVYEQSELNAVSSPSSQWVCCVILQNLLISSFVIYTKKRLILIKDGEQYGGGGINFHY